jgi:hypothetical protein
MKLFDAAVALNGQIVATPKLGPVTNHRDECVVPCEGDDLTVVLKVDGVTLYARARLRRVGT